MSSVRGLWPRPRGGALASTFLIVALLILFGFMLAEVAVFDLRSVNRQVERQKAFQAAESGLHRAMVVLSVNPLAGRDGEVFEETLADGSSYSVRFGESSTEPLSVNNLDSFEGRTGAYLGRVVPPHHALLFAEGTSPAGESVLLESLMRVEALPYAVAGTSKVAANSLQVFGAYTGEAAQQAALDNPSAESLRAGHIYGGSGAPDSVGLQGISNVTGDVRTVGGAALSGLTNVRGEVRTGRAPDRLPDFDIERFDNQDVPGVQILSGGPQLLGVLSGPVYIDGSVDFVGALLLLDATVYVANGGDFVVRGALAGRGTVFVTGETVIGLGANFTGNSRIAIFSEGDLTIGEILGGLIPIELPVGLPGLFQGVLMTHGNFKGPPLLIVLGSIYANSPADPTKGNVELGLGSIVAHVSEYTAFASFWLALGGEAEAVQVYWSQLR